MPLRQGAFDHAWDLLVGRYRRLIIAAIRHYARDYDDVMDVFAQVCSALRADDCRRLRDWAAQPSHRARFSTWLVTVVRNLTVDWFRHRDGRRRVSAIAERLPGIQRLIFEHVFLRHCSHLEAYELIRTGPHPGLSFATFQAELRAAYRATEQSRRGSLLRELGPAPADEMPAVSEQELADQQAALEDALASLPPADRAAVELYVIEELPAADVARILGLTSAKAAYNRIYRALDSLRVQLERAGVPPEAR